MFQTRTYAYGPDIVVAHVTWTMTASANQALASSQGVASVARTGAGAYDIVTSIPFVSALVLPQAEDYSGNVSYIWTDVTAINSATKTISIRRRINSFANVVNAPVGFDSQAMGVIILLRTAGPV